MIQQTSMISMYNLTFEQYIEQLENNAKIWPNGKEDRKLHEMSFIQLANDLLIQVRELTEENKHLQQLLNDLKEENKHLHGL